MKKLIALLMALTMIAAFAACGTADKNETETTTGAVEESTEPQGGENQPAIDKNATAEDILTATWALYGDDQKPAVIGGHYSGEYTEGPAAYNLEYAEELSGTLLIPAEQMAQVTEAATMIHMMNANSMTIGVVKLSEDADMQAFADGVYNTISNNQWMCGFPEKLIIAQVNEDFVAIAYGLNDLMDVFEGYLAQNWVVNDFYNEAIG